MKLQLITVFLLFVAHVSVAQVSHSWTQIPIGNADKNGFARLDKLFYKMPLGTNSYADFFLMFSTDPRINMGCTGMYWSIPFFNSRVVRLSESKYEWQSPNLGIYIFNKTKKLGKEGGTTYLLNTNGKWKLNMLRDGTIHIEDTQTVDRYYIYRKGRLVTFRDGPLSDIFKIFYNGDVLFPHSVYNQTQTKEELQFIYNKSGLLFKISLPKVHKFVYINYEDCGTHLSNPHVSSKEKLKSISSIMFIDGTKEEYRYTAEKIKKNRTILTRNGEIKEKVLVNRLESKVNNTTKGFIEWDAETGIIISDAGGDYSIRNPLLDKINTEYNAPIFKTDRLYNNRTKESKISYKKPENKYPEIWEYNSRNAVKVTQNPHTGTQTRTSYIGISGNASMKIRKIEIKALSDKNWQLSVMNTYDALGRKIRSISPNGIKEYKFMGNDKFIYFNSALIRSEHVDKKSKKLTVKLYKDADTILEYIYSEYPNYSLIHRKNNNFVYYKEYAYRWDESRIKYKELSDHSKYIYQYINGYRETLKIFPDGTKELTKYNPAINQYVNIKDINLIDKWYEKITNSNTINNNIH